MKKEYFIPVKIAEEIIDTLWKVMDTEWSEAKEAKKKCDELIKKNTFITEQNFEREKEIADLCNKITNGTWPSYEDYQMEEDDDKKDDKKTLLLKDIAKNKRNIDKLKDEYASLR